MANFHQIFDTKRNLVSRRGIWKDIFENFNFRSHLPRHLTQSRLQVTGYTAERYCLLHVVVQGPGSFRGQVNLYVRRTVVELRGVKFAQFSYFCLFSLYKTPKTYLSMTSLQPRSYIAE